MTRIAVVLAALVAVLVAAPAAFAVAAKNYVVNDPGITATAAQQTNCDTGAAGCTLPAAILDSNSTIGVSDTITFAGTGRNPGPFTAPLPQVTDPVSIDGGGNTVVSFDSAATGLLLDLEAANSTVQSITLNGGSGASTLVNLGMGGDRLASATLNPGGTGAQMPGSGTRADSVQVTGAGGAGIVVAGSNATISGGQIHGNAGNGVTISGGSDVVSRVVFYGNGGKPIALTPGANGGISPPQNLRIGPRRADGSLPLTGTSPAGTIEMWSGNPSSSSAPSFFDSFAVNGDFTYDFPSDPAPGSVFALSVTGDSGSSEFATVTVPADISSPAPYFARALDTSNVEVDFTEPLDPNSVQASDFGLTMAGAPRAISSATPTADGRGVILASSGWKAGEAGYVDVAGPGALTDTSGNAMTSASHMRVAAAPGDFIAPIGGGLRVTPRTMCLTHTRTCRKPGLTIRFISTEAGKATLVVKRSDVTVGTRLYSKIVAGPNTLKFNGRLGARKLRAGRYRLLMYVQDQVGNVTDQPPLVLFSVRRAT